MKTKPSLMLRLCHFVADVCARLNRRNVIKDHYNATKDYLIRHYLVFKDRPDLIFTNDKAKNQEERKIRYFQTGSKDKKLSLGLWLLSRVFTWKKNQEVSPWLRRTRRVYRRVMAVLGIFNLSLHRILRSDNDDAAHDHPWLFYFTIILTGGYWEHTTKGRIWRGPGSILFRWGTSKHRLELDPTKGETWTLFTMGPHIREWGFCDFAGSWWIRWYDYLYGQPMKAIKKAIEKKPLRNAA